MNNPRETIYRGRRYLSQSKFAEEMGVNRQVISRYIQKGDLTTTVISTSDKPMLEWESQSRMFRMTQLRNQKFNTKTPDPFFTEAKKPVQPKIKDNKIESNQMPDIVENREVTDISTTIDPDMYPDCWMYDNAGEPMLIPGTSQKIIDYDRLKLRLTAERYEMDNNERRGQLISKEALIPALQGIGAIFISTINSIPQRYGSIYSAAVEKILGRGLTLEEKTMFIGILKKEASNLCHSTQDEIKKMQKEFTEDE